MSEETEIVLTPGGYVKLKQRLEYLRNVQRPDIAQRLRDAKQAGELAENSEYENAKQEQALVESEILELSQLLQISQILDPEKIPTDYAGIGSIVKMTDLDSNDQWEFTLVGSVEADPDIDMISDESPIGRAIMGRKVNDVVPVRLPRGIARYRVDGIRK